MTGLPNPAVDALCRRLSALPTRQRAEILEGLQRLWREAGLAWALRALFRQQVAAGYVLFDPARGDDLPRKRFLDPDTGVELQLQWNPRRELRLHHHLLLERGILVTPARPERLLNRGRHGHGCYLCSENIALQNPGEIALPVRLGDETYHLGANFAPIADHHFTVMAGVHRPQRYHPGVTAAGLALAAATAGQFRVLFNGRAGASILEHEHLQATDTRLPIEDLHRRLPPPCWQRGDTRLYYPDYYLPLWLVSGPDPAAVAAVADGLLRQWQADDNDRHTENLLMSRCGGEYHVHILLRDRARLTGPGRAGAMASFEACGLVVLSRESGTVNERSLFENVDLERLRALLTGLRPEREFRPDLGAL